MILTNANDLKIKKLDSLKNMKNRLEFKFWRDQSQAKTGTTQISTDEFSLSFTIKMELKFPQRFKATSLNLIGTDSTN
jgi:hypothetical protein